MNIFIDTSILFTDPFLNENYKKEILTACKQNKLNIHVSEVVIKELLFNYEKSLDKIIFDIKNTNTYSSKLIPNFEKLNVPEKETLIKQLKDFYTELSELNNFHILPIHNDFLPLILEKAIKRQKPFTDKKTELKDALIWLTYVKHIKDNNLDNNSLLTQNVNDFGLKQEDKTFIIHPELQKECEKINLINSFQEIHKIYNTHINEQEEQIKQKLVSWIENENIDDAYVHQILSKNYVDNISDSISNYIDKIDLDKYFEESHLISMGGYVDIHDFSWNECSDIEIEILEENAIVSGVLDVSVEIQAYGYNSCRDPGDEKFPSLGYSYANFKVYFNFLIDEDDVHDFEITDVEDV